MRKIPLHFSDIDFGTEEFGFIPVEPGEDPDDSDRRYERHLAAQGVRGSIDRMGNLVVEGPTRRGSLRLTEGQLRRIIRQEARALREASGGFKFPADYPKEWRARERDYSGDGMYYDLAAEMAVGAGVPMQYTAAHKEMTRTARGAESYYKKMNAYLNRSRGVTAAPRPPEPEPLVSRGKAPKVRGGSRNDRAIAQDALDMLYAGEDVLETVVPYIVEQTLTYGDDEYHDAESSRPRPEGDRADEIVDLIRRVDPDAADEIEDALDGYVHY